MANSSQNRNLGFGILIIVVGLAVLLHQLNMFSYQLDDIIISWQMLLIVIGLYNLIFRQSMVAGYVLIAIGVFFLLPEIFTLPDHFGRNFWPFLLILLGLFIIFRHGPGNRGTDYKLPYGTLDQEIIDEVNIFSGSHKKITIKNFRGLFNLHSFTFGFFIWS